MSSTIDKDEFSDEELAVLEDVAERRGWEYVEENTEIILDQARLVGDLVDEE